MPTFGNLEYILYAEQVKAFLLAFSLKLWEVMDGAHRNTECYTRVTSALVVYTSVR